MVQINQTKTTKVDKRGRVLPEGFGGAVPGSGRKSKAEELGIARLLEDCWTQDQRKEVIGKLHDLAVSGGKPAVAAATLLLAYAYGKPTEHVKVERVDNQKLAAELLAELQSEKFKLSLEQARAIVLETLGDVLEHGQIG